MNRLQGVSFGLLKSKVVLIVTGVVIVLLFVWWFAWMTPEANKLTAVQQQVTADNSMVTQLNMELIALKAEQKLVLRELPYLKKVTTAIPPTEDPPGIVDSLNTLANKTGCDLLSVTPANLPSPSGVAGLSDITVTFSITGSHKQVFAFLRGFYAMTRLMTIGSVELSPGGTSPNIMAVGDGQPYSMTVSATAYTTAT
jgi:Tfp pilus assembly protein PilO